MDEEASMMKEIIDIKLNDDEEFEWLLASDDEKFYHDGKEEEVKSFEDNHPKDEDVFITPNGFDAYCVSGLPHFQLLTNFNRGSCQANISDQRSTILGARGSSKYG
nr:hypothetical protein [Tanacetum cinerariifolium]